MTTTASFLSRIGDLRSAAAQNFAGSYTTATAIMNSYQSSSLPLLQIMKELKFLLAILTILVLVTLCSSASLVTPLIRFPLRKFGVEFGSIEISVLTLSIIVHEIELSPLDVPILQIIFVALFPSANARSINKKSSSSNCNSSYPRNKIKIQRLKVSLTINSRDSANQTINWIKRAVYVILPRPMIVVKMNNVVVEVEKAYIAPAPPDGFEMMSNRKLPYAVVSSQQHLHPDIPKFDQNYFLDELQNAEITEANHITYCLERWLQHAAFQLRKNDASENSRSTALASDERLNYWISTITRICLQSISICIDSASVIISGAGADVVKEIRRKYPDPEEANFQLAKLDKEQRALTMIGASMIKMSFSSDALCNLLVCFNGLQIKVGNPLVQRRINKQIPRNVGRWEWFTVVQPFDVVAELKGIIPFVVYSMNYDHYWEERVLELDISVSKAISVTLLPSHLHTIFLHLDDYTDINSPFNQWFEWLKKCRQQTLKTSSTERWNYCRNYGRKKIDNLHQTVTALQMKGIEKKMKCSEIMSLRCMSMKEYWKVPKESREFLSYLRQSRAEINLDNVDNSTTNSSPFERTFATPLDALVALVAEKSSLFTPRIELNCHVGALILNFPPDTGENTILSAASIVGISLSSNKVHPLFTQSSNPTVDTRIPFAGVSIQANDLHWEVCDGDNNHSTRMRLPRFSDKSLVGIAQRNPHGDPLKKVLDVSVNLSVAPTIQQDLHISFDLSSADLVLVANTAPIRSACHSLLALSQLPFQESMDFSFAEDTDPTTLLNDDYIARLRTTANVAIEGMSIIFLIDSEEIYRGLLHFAVNSVKISLSSLGMSGELLVSTEPFALSAAQAKRAEACFDWSLLPFKPILTITGAEAGIKADLLHQLNDGPCQTSIDIKLGVNSTELNTSPSTTAALIGSMQSIVNLFMIETTTGDATTSHLNKQTEAIQSVQSQRKILLKVFRSAGVDPEGEFNEDALDKVIHYLCSNGHSHCAQHLTAKEIEREKDFIMSLAGDGGLTFDKMNVMLFYFAHGIDDTNFATFQAAGVGGNNPAQFAAFLSEISLRDLIHFNDLREYTSMCEVYRITGERSMYDNSHFSAPILWHRGQGVDLFWELFQTECGCSRGSLCGQEMKAVQQKLTRSLCNYEFAKYCWKSLVQPGLITHDVVETNWLLDDDPIQDIPGLFDRLIQNINNEESPLEKTDKHLCTYAISASLVIDYAAVSFGSAQTFTKPLFEATCSRASLSLSTFLSQDGNFIDTTDCIELNHPNCSIGHVIKFCSGEMNVSYLNTKHDHMDQLIEPYLCLGSVTYNILEQEANEKPPSLAIYLKCPKALFINISPVLFETASITSKLIAQADPKTYQNVLFERDKRYLHAICEANPRAKRGSLNRQDAATILKGLAQSHWQDDFEGLPGDEVDKEIMTRMSEANIGDAMIEIRMLENVLKNHVRSFFSGCKNLVLSNNVGTSMNAAACSETKVIEADNVVDMSLGRLSLGIEGYQIIEGVSLSPYQPTMLKLTRHSKTGRRKKKSASDFAPFLTVVPNQDSLDAIKLDVRSSIQIKSTIPIKIRIVRLPKKLGYLQKRNTKLVDLTKKNLAAALRRLVNGALIVHEVTIDEGSAAAVPLNIVLSSRYHAILCQDLRGERDLWRDPVLLTKDFLFNELNLREVSKCHTLSGITVRKERLNIHYPVERRSNSSTNDNIWKRTTWNCLIDVNPFFLLSNSLPIPITIQAWQYHPNDEDELWMDPTAMFSDPSSEHSTENDSNSDGETSSKSPSLMGRSTRSQLYHMSAARDDEYYSLSCIKSGRPLRMCGINLSYPLYIQFCQQLSRGTMTGWSNIVTVDLQKLRTGINPRGKLSLKAQSIRLGDTCDCFLEVVVDKGICRAALYSPFWLVNQSGMKLEYRVIGTKDNRRYVDSGAGGLPIMIHCGEQQRKKEISVIPLESPTTAVLERWWDEQSGRLVLTKHAVTGNNKVDWSQKIEMDAAGTSGEVLCDKNFAFSVSVESLAGVFFRSNLIRFAPQFVVHNSLQHMSLSLIALSGSTLDVMRKASQLGNYLSDLDNRSKVDLGPGESTVIFNFNETGGVGRKSFRWVSFQVTASEFCRPKWHLVRLDKNGTTYFGEVDRRNVMIGIIDATVNRSASSSLLCTIKQAAVPPYRIENRSNTHYLRFQQVDDDALPFVLPPMRARGYTWDNPYGRKKLRVSVVQESESASDTYDFGIHSRVYAMKNAGRQSTLPHSTPDDYRFIIHTHLRISAGTKILSFNDSDYVIDEVDKGGDFDNAFCDIGIEGVNITMVDTYPRELLAMTVRDISISKAVGSNETQLLLRHFQIDNMIPDARSPTIIQPIPLGIDQRKSKTDELVLPENVKSNDLFWTRQMVDRPSPVLEVNWKFVPQKNMLWIPALDVFLCPMKVTFDLDYTIRVASVFLGSIAQKQDDAPAGQANSVVDTNEKLTYYSSRGTKIVSLTYLERLTIAPVWFEVEISISSDEFGYKEDDNLAAKTALSLNTIAQASNSSSIAGIAGWLLNVGSQFAHVTPCFKYPSVAYIDKFCNPLDLANDIIFFYVVQTIKQSLKVLFSMQFLGDPTLLALQLKTGFSDLVFRTRDEVRSGGEGGFGRGVASFSENAVGGTFFAIGKVAKSVAITVDALVTNEFTSRHLKPRELDARKRPKHVFSGIVLGTKFFGRELVFGVAGTIGNPYRSAKRGNVSSLAKGVASGVGGLVVAPFVGCFGMVAISAEGFGATFKYLELSDIDARCRPARTVPWGNPMPSLGLLFLKAIGLRVHTVRYQKIRKAVLLQDQDEGEDIDYVTSKEIKKKRKAEIRRKNPPSKVLRIKYKKENRRYTTTTINPKLLSDHPFNQTTSHYAAVFEQTLILRASNLQLEDEVKIQFRNNKLTEGTNMSSCLGQCKIKVGDMMSHILKFHQDVLMKNKSRLLEGYHQKSDETISQATSTKSLIIPSPQEFSLMRPPKKVEKADDNVFETIANEMREIERCEEELKKKLESDSVHSEMSFLEGKKKEEDTKGILNKHERLFGSVSISFYPIQW